jgi:hypothetical protein
MHGIAAVLCSLTAIEIYVYIHTINYSSIMMICLGLAIHICVHNQLLTYTYVSAGSISPAAIVMGFWLVSVIYCGIKMYASTNSEHLG